MDVGFYISDLLYQHDCVIVPGFGGFVATYSPAKIHPVTHTFHPPSKNILFNSKLTRDDGLLIDYICQKKGISYKEAKTELDFAVWEITKKLEKKEQVYLKEVGVLQYEAEGRIIFEPDGTVNYLEDSFGLTSFVSPPVVRKGIRRQYEPGFVDRRGRGGAGLKVSRRVVTYVAAIAILIVGAWYGMNSGLLRFGATEQANMSKLPDPIFEKITGESPETDPLPLTVPLREVDFTEEMTENTESVTKDPALPEDDLTPSVFYHIIGGAFANEINADKLLIAMQIKGFNAQRSGLSPSGLHMVSYLVTPDKNEALMNLAIIRKDENPSAWLLKK